MKITHQTMRSLLLCAALLTASRFTALAGEGPAREEAILVSITASVESVDTAKREVTLKGPLGNVVTFTVDQKVKRFDEIKKGDLVTADYYVSIAAELREPTAAEKATPIVALEGGAKAPPGTTPPAAGGLRRFKVVATIEGLDRPTKTVTLKGPMGNYFTTRVADPDRLTKVHIGDTVVLTYTEALAISLEKVEKKAAN